MYDRNGSKMVDKEGGVTMEDAAGFFANVFGGERFVDYVSFKIAELSDHDSQCGNASPDRSSLFDEGDDERGNYYDERRGQG